MNISPIMIRALIELEDFHDLTDDQASYDAVMKMTLGEIRRLADIQVSAEYALELFEEVVAYGGDAVSFQELEDDYERMITALGVGAVH